MNPMVNPRQYLTQGLFEESESESESEDEEEEEKADQGSKKTSSGDGISAAKGQSRTGSVPSEKEKKGVDDDDDEDMKAYEKAAQVKNEAQRSQKEQVEKVDEVKPTELQSERSIQDSLSGELLRMAGILKANSMAFADALERDRKILEEAGEKLQGNLTLMTRTRGRLGEYSQKARGMGWLTLGSVAVVCMSWVVMFILIRLT
jgi:hypothetical protein